MSLQNLSCKVLADLGRHGAAMAADELETLAIEREADLMLSDTDCARGMGESFIDQLIAGTPSGLLDELHLYIGQQLLRRVHDRNPMGPSFAQLTSAARRFVDAAAANQLKSEAE
ncbi:hypothetical protein HA052_11110 [Chromobacterium haemolyticum]|uniref:Uncharacterized protein n=1 Tax=Chromobacterium fluminis TaxID=3044269 RepID=A0ABX0L231_9NEIS|nr:hypothetical protein [Chromobacterium haemolyticum]NHR05749.1 hypothetical protein [Chromobacterium haemolyticum]